MSALVELVAPARMGVGFRRLLASGWASNLGDGLALAAGPLLVADLTRDPLLISAAVLVQRLPWMLFGLYAGVLADKYDRRRLVAGVDAIRAVVIVALAVTIVTDVVNIWIALAALFALGTLETFADIATGTLLPMVVDDADLGVGNARLQFGFQGINQLAGPPLGAALFGLGMAIPFVAQAVLVGFAARMVAGMVVRRVPEPEAHESARSAIRAGARWLWHHGPMRTLTLTIFAFNVTFGAAWAVLVLYALERLELNEIGFGLWTASAAVGSLVGIVLYGAVDHRIGPANIMRAGLVIEAVTHLTLALTRAPVAAFVIMFVFGVHTGMWGTTVHTVRQRQVPLALQGRVGSVYMLAMQGGLVIGTPIGGLLAGWQGLTAPYWFAFAGSVLILFLIWRQLAAITSPRAPVPAGTRGG
ncbi:MAG TPA: MFS transporter [Ilumatobacter sp.]|nr:MFS transporter [Ilumatobacter sp.]